MVIVISKIYLQPKYIHDSLQGLCLSEKSCKSFQCCRASRNMHLHSALFFIVHLEHVGFQYSVPKPFCSKGSQNRIGIRIVIELGL